MNATSLACPRCRAALQTATLDLNPALNCPGCRTELEVFAFPALFRPITAPATAERVIVEGESTCFFHPQKKALVPCADCGRFLCALCDVELHGLHYCPACLTAGQKKGRIADLQRTRPRPDNTALALVIGPLILCFIPLIITAPIALWLVIRHWKTPASLVDRSRVRLVVAGILAVVEFVFAAIMWWSIFVKG